MIKPTPKFGKEYAYKMGYDCGINGANTTNCHFAIFFSEKTMRAWEQGKRDAIAQTGNGEDV